MSEIKVVYYKDQSLSTNNSIDVSKHICISKLYFTNKIVFYLFLTLLNSNEMFFNFILMLDFLIQLMSTQSATYVLSFLYNKKVITIAYKLQLSGNIS